MNVLLLGSGGREHALAWKMAQSKKLTKLYIAPGNPGTAGLGENIPININDFEMVKATILSRKIDTVVVGPEDPLVNGIADYIANDPKTGHVSVIGPNKKGAQLEGSKDFAKAFMKKYQIPTAGYETFTLETLSQAYEYIDKQKAPYVLKADGLAAGKGVLILNDAQEAKNMLAEMLNGKFGKAGNKVVIEEYLSGIEVSVFVLTDGKNYKLLPEAKDYKRIGEGDTGLNTGGMGAVSPVYFADEVFLNKVRQQVIESTIYGLQNEGIEYKGFIFIGLMNVKGEPCVIEYNVRMGDPETEVVMPRLNTDLLDLFDGVSNGTLDSKECHVFTETALTVMCVSGGYPEDYEKGKLIKGLDQTTDSIIFHAGTRYNGNQVETNGGRVLSVTSLAYSIDEARKKSYDTIASLSFDKMYYRKDIGNDLLEQQSK